MREFRVVQIVLTPCCAGRMMWSCAEFDGSVRKGCCLLNDRRISSPSSELVDASF